MGGFPRGGRREGWGRLRGGVLWEGGKGGGGGGGGGSPLFPPFPASSRRLQLKMYLSQICARQRDNRLGSSMNVFAGPVKLNTGTGAAGLAVSKRSSLRGDVAAALATLRTPHDEFSMFRKFRKSTLSWNVWRVAPPTVKSWRIRRSTLLYHGFDSPNRSAI